jgi:hypothetical protein
MTDLFGNKIIHASEDEPITKILSRAGIELLERGTVFSYNGKKIKATNGRGWERQLESVFKIKIVYTDAGK